MPARSRIFFVLFVTLSLCVFNASQSLAKPAVKTWKEIQRVVVAQIHEASKTFKKGDIVTAKEILSDAYFEKFEALGMEMAVKKYISAAKAYQLERMFSKIRKRMTANDRNGVDKAVSDLAEALKKDATTLDLKDIQVEGAGYVVPVKTILSPPQAQDVKPKETQTTKAFSSESVAGEIEQYLKKALTLYRNGNSRQAKGLVSDAYFDLFEGKGLEAMIAIQSSSLKAELESKFGYIQGLMAKAASDEQVERAVRELSVQIIKVVGELGTSTGWFPLFIASFFIIIREGFEAILILSALITYLRRTENDEKVRIVGTGAFVAILLSVVTAFVFMKVYTQSGASREILEGITMLIAAAVLFYVSYWLTSKAEAAKWMSYIRKQVAESIGKGSMLTLGFAAFIVVYREGAETILFYSALLANSGDGSGAPIWSGFLVGVAALVAVYYAFKYGAAKIPIRPFFNVTSVFLFYMAFVFAGEGVIELQIGNLIKSTPLDWAPRIGFLGIHPTLESLSIQMMLLMAALVAIGYLYILQPFKARGKVLQEVAHILGDLQKLHDGVRHICTHVNNGMTLATAHVATSEVETSQDETGREIWEHLNEIDGYSDELIDHLNGLQERLTLILGNLDNKKVEK